MQSGGGSMLWKMRLRFCFDVDIGGVDMLVPAELRQSGSLPWLSVAVRWKARAGAPWQPRWGTEKRDGGQQVRTSSCGASVA